MNATIGNIGMPVSLSHATMKIKKQVNPRKEKAGRSPWNAVTIKYHPPLQVTAFAAAQSFPLLVEKKKRAHIGKSQRGGNKHKTSGLKKKKLKGGRWGAIFE